MRTDDIQKERITTVLSHFCPINHRLLHVALSYRNVDVITALFLDSFIIAILGVSGECVH